jgi:hypothetical protein
MLCPHSAFRSDVIGLYFLLEPHGGLWLLPCYVAFVHDVTPNSVPSASTRSHLLSEVNVTSEYSTLCPGQ